MKNILFGLLLLLNGVAFAQDRPEMVREREFLGKALYGFMNGGSDLYYEYGFEKLVAREVNYMGEEFIIENYAMGSAEDAFGIYSLHTFRCQRTDSLGGFDCQSQYQTQVVAGNQYVSIVFQSGTDAARDAADKLLNIYAPNPEEGKIEIPQELAFLPKPYSNTVKLLRGPLAINNTYSDFLPWVDGMTGYSVWLAEMEGCALFVLKNEDDFNTVKNRVPASDIIKTGDNFILVAL